ncbi:hypothetical protein GYMLUDRAFT_614083 [Collybiopsis luxurians FD-317 M1]|uniref:Uncharacterized protein n=1 Tax=Collybiopsis luxurians FD-317 M1 TaxID=944289 RepID=A0A0D0B986_9AGAR|nr:hypothetical protein GYMLUDRAFT_614083 [Collybiopsis luxurians FD-317 M1]
MPALSSTQQRIDPTDSLEEHASQLLIKRLYRESGIIRKVMDSNSGKELGKQESRLAMYPP